jgi:predicted transcriptional regulator
MKQTNRARNRDILAAIEAGETWEAVTQRYGLTASTVRSIVTSERHKQAVSADEFYRELRRSELTTSAERKKLAR